MTKDLSNTTVMSRDIIKELVDKEVDLEQCIKTIQKLSEDSKLISGDSSSVSISMSQKFKTDGDVFTEIIIDELKRENRDLKFALVARDQRLEDAASKVTQLIEQNTFLSQKVERTALDHSNQVKDLIEAQKRYLPTYLFTQSRKKKRKTIFKDPFFFQIRSEN